MRCGGPHEGLGEAGIKPSPGACSYVQRAPGEGTPRTNTVVPRGGSRAEMFPTVYLLTLLDLCTIYTDVLLFKTFKFSSVFVTVSKALFAENINH